MLYEGGIRVPFVAHWSGQFGAARVESTPIIGVDLLPTILKLAGGNTSKKQFVDGESIVPLFQQKKHRLETRPIYWHFPAYLERYRGLPEQGPFRTTPASAIRVGRWKLIRFYESGREELYDLETDLSEANDAHAKHPDIAQQLSVKLDDWLKQTKAFVPTKKNPKYSGVKGE